MTDLKKHLESITATAVALEDMMRRTGTGYMKDCATDAASAMDEVARKAKRKGFVILQGADRNSFEVHPIGGATAEVKEEPKHVGKGNAADPELAYEQCHEESESYAKGKAKHPAADAARVSRLSAEARSFAADQYDRNARFAQTLKEKSRAYWDRQKVGQIKAF